MTGISGIISAFWNNNLHLLNTTAKLSAIIHHIYAEYIVFPMATHLLDWGGVLYIRHSSSRNTLLLHFVILKLATLCLGPQNNTLSDFRVKCNLFCWIFRVLETGITYHKTGFPHFAYGNEHENPVYLYCIWFSKATCPHIWLRGALFSPRRLGLSIPLIL